MLLSAEQIAALIDEHAAALRIWIGRRCASPEDVVQGVFCRLVTLDPAPDRPAAWLYRACRNLAEKQRRSDERRERREHLRASKESTYHDPSAAIETAEALAAVAALNDELREVLVARIWGQMTLEEVGELCGISTTTAFRRYEAALQFIREKLDTTCRTHSN